MNKVLKKRDKLVKKSKSRCQNNRFKFGVEVKLIVEDTLRIDLKNGNTLWHESIGKDMKNSRVALNLLDRDNHAPFGYKEITWYQIFNIEMDLTRKARYVAIGRITNPPSSMTHISVVSNDSVRLVLLI